MGKSYHAKLEDQQKRPTVEDKIAVGIEMEKAKENAKKEGRDFNPHPSAFMDDIDIDRWNERI